MLWKFNSVYNPERQFGRPRSGRCTYEMRPPRVLTVKPTKEDLYVHAPAPAQRLARG